MKNVDIARKAEREILLWLARFGWLTTRQIATLMHDEERHKSFDIALRWTQTVLKRIHQRGWVNCRKEPFREARHALAAKGCREIELHESEAKDALRYDSAHREECNWVAIRFELSCRKNPEWCMWTEREIQRGLGPFRSHGKKIPDGLLRTDKGYIWVEVEASRRSQKDMKALVNWLTTHVCRFEFNKDTRKHTPEPININGVPIIRVVVSLVADTARTFKTRLADMAKAISSGQQGFTTNEKIHAMWGPVLAVYDGHLWDFPLPFDEPEKKPMGPLERKYRERLRQERFNY